MGKTQQQFELIIKASALQAVAEIKKSASAIRDGFSRAKLAGAAFNKTMGGGASAASAATSQIRNLVAAVVSLTALTRTIKIGYQFNSVIEETRIGIASLIYSMNSMTNASGRAMNGQEGFTAALARADTVQNALRISGLKTAATYEQLTKAYAQSYVPAIKAGFDDQQVVQFTAAVTQAATAMRIPLDMLGEEVRSILRGVMTPRTTLLQPLMDAAGLTNEKIRELAKSGKLYEEVMKALEGAQIGAAAAAGTMTVRLSNMKDALSQVLGAGMTASFSAVKQLLADITDSIYQVDAATGQIRWNEDFLRKIRAVDKAAARMIEGIKSQIASLYNFTQNHRVLSALISDMAVLIAKAALAATAIRVIIGLFSPLVKIVKALNVAFAVMTGMSVSSWLGSVRLALVAATAQVTALSIAFQAFIAFAAVQGIYNLTRLANIMWDWVDASKKLKQAQLDLASQKAWVDPKIAEKLKEISAQTGIAIKTFEQYEALLKKKTISYDLSTGKYFKTPETPEAEKPVTAPVLSDAEQKKIADDQMRLEKQLAIELLEISGQKWAALKEQARQSYEDQLAAAHDNAQLMAQAKALYEKTLAGIDKQSAAEAAGKNAAIETARNQSALDRMRAYVETSLSVLDSTYKKGELALGAYFDRRRALVEQRAKDEIDALKRLADAETDPAEKLQKQTEIYEKEQALSRELLELANQRGSAEKQIADNRRQATQIMEDLKSRTIPAAPGADASYTAEQAEMDKRHQEEIQKLIELRATEDQINEAFRMQQSEKNNLLADQERRILEQRMQTTATIAGGMSDIFTNLYKLSGEKQKEFFYLAKAAALAEAIVNTAMAVTKALAEGGPFAGPVLAGVAAASGALQIATIAAQQLAKGGPVGGYSPTDTADNVPIWATAGEYMQPVSAVKYYGVQAMEAIKQQVIPREFFSAVSMPDYRPRVASYALAAGGPVPTEPGGGAGSGARSGADQLNIVNMFDPAEIRRYMASADGQKSVLNVISSSRGTVRRLLR